MSQKTGAVCLYCFQVPNTGAEKQLDYILDKLISSVQ